MKRIIAICLVIVAMLNMCACGLITDIWREKNVSADDFQEDLGWNSQQDFINSNDQDSSSHDDRKNEYQEIQSYCEQLVSQGDTLFAYTYIKEKADEDASYNKLLQKYAQIYVEDTLEIAEDYADQGDYQQAIYLLEEANEVYNCSEFKRKIEEYNTYLPCKLPFCKVIDDEDYEYMRKAEDCFGNQYQEVFGFSDSFGNDDGGYAVFYLNGKYNSLSGTFVGSTELFDDMEVSCKIYADGKLIYESSKLGKTSPPVNINLDVTGTQQLRVEYMWYSWWTTDPCCIFDLTVS